MRGGTADPSKYGTKDIRSQERAKVGKRGVYQVFVADWQECVYRKRVEDIEVEYGRVRRVC